jgi:hypothetical protein
VKRNVIRATILIIGVMFISLVFVVGAKGRDLLGTVNTYWRVHDEILLPTESGRRYIGIFWEFNDEMFQLVTKNPDISEMTLELLDIYEPSFEALLDDRGGEVVITQDQIEVAQNYFVRLTEVGSPALQRVLREENSRFPLEGFIGMTMEDARVRVLGWMPEPTSIPTAAND